MSRVVPTLVKKVPDQSIDVSISNCVINLSVDKDAVLREAVSVLNPAVASPCQTSSFAAMSCCS